MRWRFGIALVVACAVWGVAAPVHAQQDFVDSDPAVVRARAQLAETQLAASQAAAALEATNEERDTVQAGIDEHLAKIDELQREQDALVAQRAALQTQMRDRAVALYRNGGDGTGIAAISDASSAMQGARRQVLGEAAADSNQRAARQLEAARIAVAQNQTQQRTEESDLRAQQDRLEQLAAAQESQQAALASKVDAANAALAQARAVGALHAAGDPIMGDSQLTAEQLAGWVRSQGFHPNIETDLVSLAQLFIDEGRDENVRGDFAFAQAVVETGGFESAPANNFSGIGWCDTCKVGNQFPTPQDGVRAQIQLLREYADAGITASQLTHPVSPYLYGSDPVVAARRFDNFYAKGFAPTWSEMGNGNWATDPKYSGKVIGIYRRMEAYAQGG
jgi:peptidoglycan hydrolase CwlO-like protein